MNYVHHYQEKAKIFNLSRKVLNYSFDSNVQLFRALISVSSNGREETDYVFVKAEHDFDALMAAKARATAIFLGETTSNYIEVTKQPTQQPEQPEQPKQAETPKQLEIPKEESNEQNVQQQQETSSKESVKKSTSKKASKKSNSKEEVNNTNQSDVVKNAKEEEMEEVPSPFKEFKEEKKVIKYDRSPEQKAILSQHLTQLCGGDKWKTMKGVTEFSSSLIGLPFIYEDRTFVPEFAKKCADFVGATNA